MAHMWSRGVLNASSWHGLEEIGVFTDAASLIAHGTRSGAIPVSTSYEPLFTASGLKTRRTALIAHYLSHPDRVVGENGDRYHGLAFDGWCRLVEAACDAGARPSGVFSLDEGRRTVATFEVGPANGLRSYLLLADSYDGSSRLCVGFCTIRVVCANTLAIAMQGNRGLAGLAHTASLGEKIAALIEAIGEAVERGQSVREAYDRAKRTRLTKESVDRVLEALYPTPAPDASENMKSRAEKTRADVAQAARNAVNAEEGGETNLATLWNAATFLVDRTAEGHARKVRGDGESLKSMLFGERGQTVTEVQATIEAIMADGTIERLTIPEAQEHGLDSESIGRALLQDMLAEM